MSDVLKFLIWVIIADVPIVLYVRRIQRASRLEEAQRRERELSL